MSKGFVTTQVDRLKVPRNAGLGKNENTAHFEAMFGARIRYFRQSTAIVLF
jgi:hypothetical protein